MLCAGDEMGRTQRGNNNAYCQDNEISWVDWDLDERDERLLAFTRSLLRIRREQPTLRRRKFFQGRRIRGSEVKDLTWFHADGGEMTDAEWSDASLSALGLRLAGDAIDERDARGARIVGDTLLILLNAGPDEVAFALPGGQRQGTTRWHRLFDTAEPDANGESGIDAGTAFALAPRSVVLFRRAGNGDAP
jgi:glycogen operon protein